MRKRRGVGSSPPSSRQTRALTAPSLRCHCLTTNSAKAGCPKLHLCSLSFHHTPHKSTQQEYIIDKCPRKAALLKRATELKLPQNPLVSGAAWAAGAGVLGMIALAHALLEAQAPSLAADPPGTLLPPALFKPVVLLSHFSQDDLIDRLGGPAKVAEMTGRTKRMVRTPGGGYT